MLNNNLIQVIRSLNKVECRELALFIGSAHVNKRKDIILLFEYLMKFLSKKPSALNKEMAFQAIFPKQVYDEKKIRYTISFLHKVVERFLIYKELQNDDLQSRIYLLQAYRRKGISRPFYKAVNKTTAIVAKNPYRNDAFYEKAYQVEYEKYSFSVNTERNAPRNLQALNDMMDLSYLTKKLRISCVSLAHQSVYKVDYDKGLLNSILNNMEQSTFFENPIVAIYYFYLKAFASDGDTFYYEKFRAKLNEHVQIIPKNELRDIYLLAINYCIKRLNRGNRQYIREAFELYRTALHQKVLLENGFLSSFTYNNIHSLGFALNELEWIEHFLENYKAHLYPKDRENTYRYNRAVFHFRKAEYTEAMSLLQQVEFKDVLYNSDARSMLLRIYYERQEFDALDSLLESFKTYIHRNKNIGYHGENYLTLISFVKKMLKNNIKDKNFRRELIQEIKETKVLAEREWLLEQLGE